MNVHEIVLKRNIWLHLGLIWIHFWIQDQFFHFSIMRWGILGIKHELKELQMNVYEMCWRNRPSDKEQSITFWD